MTNSVSSNQPEKYKLASSPPLQLSLSNLGYTITILISIAELGSEALTVFDFSQTVNLSFLHKSPNKSSPLWLGFF